MHEASYLTSHYGIPHGHAVYMVFPYILRNNAGVVERLKVERLNVGRINDIIRRYNESGLKTLPEFAEENGISWETVVESIFSNVNLKRLGNNPVEVCKESFYG